MLVVTEYLHLYKYTRSIQFNAFDQYVAALCINSYTVATITGVKLVTYCISILLSYSMSLERIHGSSLVFINLKDGEGSLYSQYCLSVKLQFFINLLRDQSYSSSSTCLEIKVTVLHQLA